MAPDRRILGPSVLRAGLLVAAAQFLYENMEPTESEIDRVRVLFNTWNDSAAITVTLDARTDTPVITRPRS